MRRILILAILLSGWHSGWLFGQNDLTFYYLNTVPQRIYQNPSFIPGQKAYIGLPVLSGMRYAVAYPFSYNNLFVKGSDDSLTFKPDKFLKKISNNNYLRFYSAIDILSFGIKIKDTSYFLNFGIRQRVTQHLFVPPDLFNLLWYGNGSQQMIGRHINIAPSNNTSVYDEWIATFAGHALNGKLIYGASLKYLSGRVNITTKTLEFDFYTDTSSYKIYMRTDFEVRTSGIDNIDQYFDQRIPTIIFPGNWGLGMDLGATYRINEKYSVNASVLDLGFIRWKTNTLSFVSHEAGKEVIFKGLTLKDFMDVFKDVNAFEEKVIDSISDLIDIDSVYGVSYTTSLPVRFNAGGTYTLNEYVRFNILFNGILYGHHLFPALSISYATQVKRFIGLVASYSLFNNQYTNVGLGLSFKLPPVQFYLVSDNVLGLIAWKSTNNQSFQFGINIIIREPR